MTDLIKMEVEAGIATLTLNRPEKRNAMSDDMRMQFVAALESVAADRNILGLVLTGAGKAFCAGGDIAGMEQRMQAPAGEIGFNGWHRQQGVHRVQGLLHMMPKPTIAAVNGAASGLGADTALACDFIIVSPWASFTWSYVHRGIVADGGGMYFLPRRTSLPKAKELIFSGRKVDVDEAIALGIADRKTTADGLVPEAQAWARELTKGSAAALALAKTILNQSYESSAEQIFRQGSMAQGLCYTTTAHRESVMAFLSNSTPKN